MDPDLFSPADTQALLAIGALIANRRPARAELEALFVSTGWVRGAAARDAQAQDLPMPSHATEGRA